MAADGGVSIIPLSRKTRDTPQCARTLPIGVGRETDDSSCRCFTVDPPTFVRSLMRIR